MAAADAKLAQAQSLDTPEHYAEAAALLASTGTGSSPLVQATSGEMKLECQRAGGVWTTNVAGLGACRLSVAPIVGMVG